VKDATAVALAAGRVRRGNVVGALALLTRQAAALIECPVCAGAGEITECRNDGRCGCSHTYDDVWTCTGCRGEGEVTPDRAAELVATSDVEP
jgi:hypothetical protein